MRIDSILLFPVYATAFYTQFMIEVPKGLLAAKLDLPDIGRKKSLYYGLFLDSKMNDHVLYAQTTPKVPS